LRFRRLRPASHAGCASRAPDGTSFIRTTADVAPAIAQAGSPSVNFVGTIADAGNRAGETGPERGSAFDCHGRRIGPETVRAAADCRPRIGRSAAPATVDRNAAPQGSLLSSPSTVCER
jgi:hypothetical protein